MKRTAALLFLTLFFAVTASASDVRKFPDQDRYYDEVLVTYKASASQDDLKSFSQKHSVRAADMGSAIKLVESIYGFKRARTYLPASLPFTCYKIGDITRMDEIVSALKNEPVISSARPNYKRRTLYTGTYAKYPGPNDPYYQTYQQWYFWQVRADKAREAGLLDMAPLRNVIAAVIDTGILLQPSVHEDLSGLTVNGYNVLSPASQPNDDDTDGHGTHVAGVMAANTDNTKGMAGAAYCNATWTAKVLIMPVKALDSTGTGADSDIYTGVVWAADNGADVINLSLGGPDMDSVLQQAMNYAYTKGCVIVAAAGNNSTSVFYPAAYSNVISVSATDMTMDAGGNTHDTFADFSNFGKVEVSAPGVDILSCSNDYPYFSNPAKYSFLDGTSFSSPIVSGLAALLKLKNPSASPDDIRYTIINSADDAGAPGFDSRFGWGRVNFYRALTGDYNTITDSTIKTYNWPNPFSPDKDMRTNINFLPGVSEDFTLYIYDGGGSLVWKKDVPAASIKTGLYNTVKWDGMNGAGQKAGTGTYFYIIKAKSGKYGKNKITVLY